MIISFYLCTKGYKEKIKEFDKEKKRRMETYEKKITGRTY